MDIAEKMRELIAIGRKGIEDIPIPLEPECEESWSPDYAIVKGYYADDSRYDGSSYHSFDATGFLYDFEKIAMEHFGPDAYKALPGQRIAVQVGTVVVTFHLTSQEIEVYRVKAD